VTSTAPLLSVRQVTKRFPSVLANDRVDFDAYAGEVHALLGENGAGKSTLMKIAYGYYVLDSGQIRLEGKPVRIGSPRDARALGIGMVFQSFSLILGFTVAENIALYLPDLPEFPDSAAIAAEIHSRAEHFGFEIDPGVKAGLLSPGDQQKVEILKLLMGGAKVLIFDEPTSVLPPHEIDSLFEVFRRLKEAGYAIVFITHKLHEVLGCADRITVMRRGAVTATLPREGATEQRLLELMFGAAEAAPTGGVAERQETAGVPLLEFEHVDSGGAGLPLHDIDLCVRAGEILGVAGVSGNGQRELGDAALGLLPIVRGRLRLFGQDATGWDVDRIRNAGVGFIPENPSYMAVVPGMTLAENFAMTAPGRYQRFGGMLMDWPRVKADLDAAYRSLDLDPPDPAARASALSGGNLQRFSVARELGRAPRLIVALYPTQGLDAMTTDHVQQVLRGARNAGAGVLLISQELSELFEIGDRIAVLRGGRIAGIVRPAETTPLEVGRLMTGGG
jgi:general nucleoside transport system ATP-binding protein